MYFKELESYLNKFNNQPNKLEIREIISKIDTWLAMRHISEYKHITPASISRFSSIPPSIIYDFLLDIEEKTGLLSVRYDIVNPDTFEHYKVFSRLENIPDFIELPESDSEFEVVPESILIYFTLNRKPDKSFEQVNDFSGKIQRGSSTYSLADDLEDRYKSI